MPIFSDVKIHPLRPQIGSLTGLRFFAALYVFTFHFGAGFAERIGVPTQVVTFLKNGYIGVSFFFVLSGFILTYTYRSGVQSLGKYWIARLGRIYPVYFLALMFALPFAYQTLDVIDIVKVLTMLQSWTLYPSESGYTWLTQAWTLSVELAFYILFPILLVLMNNLSKMAVIICATLMCFLIVAWGIPNIAPGSSRPDLPLFVQAIPLPLLRLPEFILGMLTCQLFFIWESSDRFPARHGTFFCLLSLIFILAVAAKSSFQSNLMGFATVIFTVFVYFLSTEKSAVARILSHPALILLGGASYAMYLLQAPTRELVRLAIASEKLGQLANPLVLITLSILVFYYFEKPARKIILNLPAFISTKASSHGYPSVFQDQLEPSPESRKPHPIPPQ